MKIRSITHEDGESYCSKCGAKYTGRVKVCTGDLREATYWSYSESDPTKVVTDGEGEPAKVVKQFKIHEEIPEETKDNFYWKRINKLKNVDVVKCNSVPNWNLAGEYEDEKYISALKERSDLAIAVTHNPYAFNNLSVIYRYKEEFSNEQLIELCSIQTCSYYYS